MRKISSLLAVLLLFAGCSTAPVVGTEHWVQSNGLRVNLWEKNGTKPGHVSRAILLVHGATWSGRPDFDLQIRDYSLMDALAREGWDAWTIDIHGYGRSERATNPKDWSNTMTAEQDIAVAVTAIASERGLEKIALLGWSWGTQTAGLFAMSHPERVSKLILYAPLWKGPASHHKPAPTEPRRTNTVAGAREDFVEGQYEPDVVALYSREALASDPTSPNGVLVDVRTKLPLLDPTRISVPTLIIQAERDPISLEADIEPFYARLATKDREHVLLPDGGHAVMLERSHRRFQSLVLRFLAP